MSIMPLSPELRADAYGDQADSWLRASQKQAAAPSGFESAWGMLGSVADLWGGGATQQGAGLDEATIQDILRGDAGESRCQRQWSAPPAEASLDDILNTPMDDTCYTMY